MARVVTGEQYYDLDGQLAEIKRQLRQPSGYPFDPNCLKIALQDAIEGKFRDPSVAQQPTKPTLTFTVIATTNLPALAGKKTAECFVGDCWAYRDGDFDRWFPKRQPATNDCAVSTVAPSRDDWVFAEAARVLPGVEQTEDIIRLGNSIIANGYAFKSLAQAEEMEGKTEAGEATGLRTDGYANFFFVETGDPKNPVSVGDVGRDDRGWGARVGRLGSDGGWDAGNRLLLRNVNLDTLKL